MAEALGPLEVVHQGPGVVAAYVGAILNRARQCCQIFAVIFHATGVANDPIGVRTIVACTSALGYFDYWPVIVAGDAHDHVIEGLRPDFPSGVSLRALLAASHPYGKQPILRVCDPLHRAWSGCNGAVIEVDS